MRATRSRFGLAETFVPSAAFGPLARALEGDDEVGATLARFAAEPQPSVLMAEAGALETCFAPDSREAILSALEAAERQGLAFAGPARAAMLTKSPTSQALALRQMATGAKGRFRRGAADRIPDRLAGLPRPRLL